MHRYQQQDSEQTLGEGLAEYYAANVGRVTPPAELPPESAEVFASHDACHVIFGLGTTPGDEAVVDVRTMLSCDVGARRYGAYLAQDKQARSIFKELGYGRVALATLRATPRLLRVLLEARRMTRRWPWSPPDDYRSRPLAELRREYGIRII